jgi:ZIP family zinc transporter
MHGNVLVAFGLTLFAGLSTGFGGAVVLFAKKPSMFLLSFGLGFSTGVMVYISLVELLPGAVAMIDRSRGEGVGGWLANGCFFGGIAISALIDKLVPEPENPHQAVSLAALERAVRGQDASARVESDATAEMLKRDSLKRLGPLTALIIGIHNFPEGMATFAGALADSSLGVSIAVAVAIHNIPEGIAVAVPTFFATGSRRKAFLLSFSSGLAEPIGALLFYLLLMPFLDETVVAAMLAGVAGIMVFISFDELLPTAREYGKGHTAIVGVVLGMAVMAVSLLLF